jgi:glutathione peroxidase
MTKKKIILGAVGIVALAACSSTTSDEGSFKPEPASNSSSGGTSGNAPKDPNKPPDLGIPPGEDPDAPLPVTGLDPILMSKEMCTGDPGTIYELKVRALASTDEVLLCRAKGRVLLIVNGASHCGYTPQYKPLQQLYGKYQEQGVSILAFPSKSFNQEDSDEQQVSDFCTKENGITFPLFAINPVKDNAQKGEVAQPLYQWIAAQPNMGDPVAWNFEKFLISKDGKVLKRWPSGGSPAIGGEIDLAIAEALK